MDRTQHDDQPPTQRQRELREQVEALVQRARALEAWRLLEDVPDEELDEPLRRWKWGLDPRGVVSKPASETENTITANLPWLEAHRDTYRGKWVALFCGELLAHGDTDGEVIDKLEAIGRRARAMIIKL